MEHLVHVMILINLVFGHNVNFGSTTSIEDEDEDDDNDTSGGAFGSHNYIDKFSSWL